MVTNRKKQKHKLRWRRKRANHGKRPTLGRAK